MFSLDNRVIKKKRDEATYAMHVERLQTIKRSSSQTFGMQTKDMQLIKNSSILRHNNRKREVQEELNKQKVERENRILLDKMTEIVNCNKMGLTFTTFPNINKKSVPKIKSLNEHVRRTEIVRITSENFGIVKRIQQQQSIYNPREWDREFRSRHQKLDSTSDIPLLSNTSRSVKIRSSSKSLLKSKPRESEGRSTFDDSPHTSRVITARASMEKILQSTLTDRINTSIAKKIVLHRTEAKIGIRFYYIEFSITKRHFTITLEDTKSGKIKRMTMGINKGNQLLEENNNDYDKIASKITFKDEKFEIKDYYENIRKASPMKIELFDPNLTRNDSIRQEEKDVGRSSPFMSSPGYHNQIVNSNSSEAKIESDKQADQSSSPKIQEAKVNEEKKEEPSESKNSLEAPIAVVDADEDKNSNMNVNADIHADADADANKKIN